MSMDTKLHSLGLLNRCFLPDTATEELRAYCRQRSNIIADKATASRKMQKYLKFMNFRLDVVVKDVTGQTGIAIIESIIKGETDPTTLASNRHYNCRKSEEEIAKALVGNNREDYIFCLRQEFNRYTFCVNQMLECDIKIAELLNAYLDQKSDVVDDLPSKKPYKRLNKNSLKTIDLNIVSYQYFDGVDLLEIPGVSYSTILSLMSELGPDGLSKFPTSKHFTSWLRLAPNNKVSGGKTISSKVPRGSNRLKIALRNAAQSISRLKDSPLNKFYKKIAFKKGGIKAITATARKLAVIIWNMLTKRIAYKSKEQYMFLDQKRQQITQMRKKITKFGIDPNELGLFSRPEYAIKHANRTADNLGFSER